MRRREFIAGLGGTMAWPVVARTQQLALPVVGVLHSQASTEVTRPYIAALHSGLAETGYVDGRGATVEYRWADNRYGRLPDLAADLVRRRAAVIVTLPTTPAALAAKAATQTIPIVFYVGTDPVEYGLVESWARPGRNDTGFTTLTKEVIPKRIGLLLEVAPAARLIAYLFNPTNVSSETEDVQRAARIRGIQVMMVEASHPSDIEPAFEKMAHQQARALVVSADGFFKDQFDKIGALAARHAMPSIFNTRLGVIRGGLLSYGVNDVEVHRQVGIYAGRILRGEKPADLPVQQPTKLQLAINLKTAKAIGLTVPNTLLVSADDVIE